MTPSRIELAIANRGTLIDDEDVVKMVLAVKKQVERDFWPHWGNGQPVPDIFQVLLDQPDPYAMQMVMLTDNVDALGVGKLAYHYIQNAKPYSVIFVQADLDAGVMPSVSLAHEIMEQLANPWLTRRLPGPGGLYPVEPGDPTQSDNDSYEIDSGLGPVSVSNFVLPSWFDPNGKYPYDFRGLITKPFEVRPGGYAMVYDGKSWSNVYGQTEPGGKSRLSRAPNDFKRTLRIKATEAA